MQARASSELVRREWAGAVERGVQPEAVAELDHQRDHLALFEAPHSKCQRGQNVGICFANRSFGSFFHGSNVLQRVERTRFLGQLH